MGDVVPMSQRRPSFRPHGRAEGEIGPAAIVLFTGVRIERWDETGRTGEREPGDRPTPPRRRRRRS